MVDKCTLAVIGIGNMGAALVRGIVGAGALVASDIVVCDADATKTAALVDEMGVHSVEENSDAVELSEFVIIAVKPNIVRSVVEEIAPSLTDEQTLISVAAGVSLASIRAWLGRAELPLIRIMPNTPALVGAGVLAVAAPDVDEERRRKITAMLSAVGDVVEVGENLMDAVTGLSGSGPAFVFVMIEALADGGVAAGLPRHLAQRLAVQTVLGAATLVRETGQHPEALKDAVASPGGTTIAGLAELERGSFRGVVAGAVKAAAARSRQLSSGG